MRMYHMCVVMRVLFQNIAILQNNNDNTELEGDDDLDENDDNEDKDDDGDDENPATNADSRQSQKIRALVIYVFNEKTGIMESATQLVNTEKPRTFGQNVENAKAILEGKISN